MGVRVSLPGLHLLGTGGGWFVGVVGSSVMARGLHICAKSGVSLLGRTGSMGRFAHGDCRIAGGSELQRMGYRQGVSSTLGLLLVATALPRARRAASRPGPPQGRCFLLPLPQFILCTTERDVDRRSCFLQGRFTTEVRVGLGMGSRQVRDKLGGAAAAVGCPARKGLRPLLPLEPARRGTSSGALARPRVAKVQACKVRIGPARREKRPGSPSPPRRGADWPGCRAGTALS